MLARVVLSIAAAPLTVLIARGLYVVAGGTWAASGSSPGALSLIGAVFAYCAFSALVVFNVGGRRG